MDVALVGFTRSYNDLQWLEMAGAWVAAREPSMPWATATRTTFDLRGEGCRNFLDDTGVYDAVVLFAIYNPPAESEAFRKALGSRRGQTSLASNHSRGYMGRSTVADEGEIPVRLSARRIGGWPMAR